MHNHEDEYYSLRRKRVGVVEVTPSPLMTNVCTIAKLINKQSVYFMSDTCYIHEHLCCSQVNQRSNETDKYHRRQLATIDENQFLRRDDFDKSSKLSLESRIWKMKIEVLKSLKSFKLFVRLESEKRW